MRVILVALLACLLVAAVAAKKRHHKSHHDEKSKTTTENILDQLDILAADNKVEEDGDDNAAVEAEPQPKADPCANHHCSTGRECDIDDEGKPLCVCIRQCPSEADDRRKVCSNYNDTWDSDCELYRMRCLCDENNDQCIKRKYKHAHVDYYGACRDLAPCSESEMADFPRRMRDWLFNVMKDMADRHELKGPYLELEREAERAMHHKWVNAVIWKFCDLDTHPHDRSVSRHELFPIRAPLLAMEHCIAPFLNSCDADDDHQITLLEWGNCLGLEEGEIQDKCPK